MISIRDKVEELERFHRLREAATDCYVLALRDMAEYAINLEESLTEAYQKQLAALAEEVAAASPEKVKESREALRNLLRGYRDQALRYLNEMREELADTTRALEEIMHSLVRTGGEGSASIQTALARLRQVSTVSEVQAMQKLALAAADAIEASVDEMRKQHELTVAQFQAEIRVLHRRIDVLERNASIDALTRVLRRDEIEQRLAQGLPGYQVLMIQTAGFRLAASRHQPEVVAQLMSAFSKRLRNSLPREAEIGQWSEEGFVALLQTGKLEAARIAKWICEHLSGPYTCLLNGKTLRAALQVSVAVLDGNTETASQMLARMEHFLCA
jgi:GGDEF domain-containing protein